MSVAARTAPVYAAWMHNLPTSISIITTLFWLLLGSAAQAQPLRAPLQAPTTACGYQTVSMVVKYTGEERAGGYYETAVEYFDSVQRVAHRVFVRDGLLVNASGLPIDWARAEYTDEFGASLLAIFVMDECGRIYLTYHHDVGIVHHSSFLAGAPVASAGEALIVDGRLLEINNGSGHYRPVADLALQVLHRLKVLGANLSMVGVNMARFETGR